MALSHGVDQFRSDVAALRAFLERIFNRTSSLGKRTRLIAICLFLIPLLLMFTAVVEFFFLVAYVILIDSVLAVATPSGVAPAKPINAEWRRA